MRQGKENRGGARKGAGRKPGPQPHLRTKNPRTHRTWISLNDVERAKLERRSESTGKPMGTLLYEFAKKGGL